MNPFSQDGDDTPGDLLHYTELARSAVDLGMLLQSWPAAWALPRGDGHPVLVLPGLLTTNRSTRLLRAVLAGLGYAVYGWRAGRNVGPTERAVHGLLEHLNRLGDRFGRPVSLIGWSLGGIHARRTARRRPEVVRQVITLGSPFRLARAEQSRAHALFDRYAHRHVERWDLPFERDLDPLPVPATAIYSRLDGIVAWGTCLDRPAPRTENIGVYASHLGLVHHPAVIWAIADRLAQPAGSWEPFRAPLPLRMAYVAPSRHRRS